KIMECNGNMSAEVYAQNLAKRQMIDIQMIKGSFRTAQTRFLEIENIRSDRLWKAEMLRFRGHIERFNMCFKNAEGLYRQAKQLAEESNADAMLGKALTNLVETLCWVAPHTALDAVDDAIDLNETVQAPIEIGKAVSAQSLAFTFTGSYDQAIASSKHSYEIQKKNGYLSGLLFALQAEGIARCFMKDLERVVSIVDEMDQITDKLDVYGFLKIPLLLVIDIDRAKSAFSCYEWLDTNEIINSHQYYMRLL
ncbi:MAG: hypothetical protein R8J85_04620, partial [Mariprofundales bacterium]